MASDIIAEASSLAAGPVTAQAHTGTPETTGAGITAAGDDLATDVGEAVALKDAGGTSETGFAAASGGRPADPATARTASRPFAPSGPVLPALPASTQPSAPSRASSSGGVVPAGECGCGGGGGGGGGGGKKTYVFAIGNIGVDFGTEAGRDAFRQLMKRVETASRPPVSLPPNPYDVNQLVDYLDGIGYSQPHKYDSTKLIWTLNLDATPIYAIETELAYAEDVYEVLRSALRNEALPTTDENYVSRVSIPGILTGKTRRLFSGQIVPVVVTQPRGLYTWNETALVNQIVQGVLQAQPETSEEFLRLTIRNFVDKIYYQLRNLGQTSSDRALNYSATNAFVFAEVVQQGLLTAQNLPGAPDHLYTLDTINVSKSPYCRMDSDCWDVQVSFFDPENDRRARAILQYTIDVSDELPVSLAPTRQFLVAS
jgi:cyanobactin maturation PatA/PatG family protease